MNFTFISTRSLALAVTGALIAVPLPTAAQEAMPIVTFPFASLANLTADIIVAKGFDKAHGFDAKPVTYGTGGALWAGVAKGEIYQHSIGPYQLQKMAADGVPLALYATLVRMDSLQVISRNPKIKKFSDLKGGSFAATVGFAEFDYLQIYAKRLGFNLREDVTIVNATTALAQAQLEAGRVDAILAWEPSATLILGKNKDAHVVVNGEQAWRHVTGDPGWQLILFARTDYLAKSPTALGRLVKMYQDAATFVMKNPDEADDIISSNKYASKNIPKGTIAQAVKAKRLILEVTPSWEPNANKQIWRMLEVGLADGYIPKLPPPEAVISKAPAN